MRLRPASASLALAGAAAAAAFVLLLIITRLGLTQHLDVRITELVQARPSHTLDRLASADTLLGDPILTGIAALAFSVWLLRERSSAFLAPLLILVVSGVELVGKMSIIHAPPPSTYVRAAEHLLSIGSDAGVVSSFPSGHVARVAFLAITTSALVPNAVVRVATAALVGATMVARVYLGDHWPSDTVGGLLLGVAVAILAVMWITAGDRRTVAIGLTTR
jgi:undecaprenyl-diphosphatase